MNALAPVASVPRFRVRYYDVRLSRKGRGVQVRHFAEYDAAAEFAAKNVLYAKPCKVETIATAQAS